MPTSLPPGYCPNHFDARTNNVAIPTRSYTQVSLLGRSFADGTRSWWRFSPLVYCGQPQRTQTHTGPIDSTQFRRNMAVGHLALYKAASDCCSACFM